MATPAERMRTLRERARRGIRRLVVDVSDDDLRTLVRRGYEGAAAPMPISKRKPSVSSSTIAFSKSG